jgi:hypothetical protein
MVYVIQVCRQLLSRIRMFHVVGFIIRKFFMMHGNMNVKNLELVLNLVWLL